MKFDFLNSMCFDSATVAAVQHRKFKFPASDYMLIQKQKNSRGHGQGM